ncbi:E3 ubiquitin-protein ligase ATL4-like [Henckelia pumila]|uniref:E3 ubiquitin-protein ligase ATL4-like n=1 Tax=Henckelia pumila TaxID=405737 RepID=UPI003C6E6C34
MFVCDQDVVCKAALIFAVTRCLLSFARNLVISFSNSSSQNVVVSPSSRHSPTSLDVTKTLGNSLKYTTLGNIQRWLPETRGLSCAVCLNRLRRNNKVWELRNCGHVFHKHCLEEWLRHDARSTCPLCRSPLLADSPVPPPVVQPSWAVERLLYLLGDDLLP